jgi:uncharacterized membrane-anchored protein
MEKRLLIVLAILGTIFIGFLLYAALPVITGNEVELRLAPVDPTDLLAGEYLNLNYDISRMQSGVASDGNFSPGDKIYVELSGGTPASAMRYSHTPLSGIYIKGSYDGRRIEYGIEQYYIPEGAGGRIDSTYTAKVRIDARGNARLVEIMQAGKRVEFKYAPK